MKITRALPTLIALCLLLSALGASWAQIPLNIRTPYRLQVDDTVQIKYRYTPQYDETVKVQPDGSVSLQLAGHVQLAGQTLDEAKQVVLKGIGGQLVDPQIDLELASFEKPYFVIAGQVTTPGRHEITGTQVSVVEAIAEAGGFKNSARNTQVIVYHKSGEDLVLRYVVDCKKAMEHPNREIASMAVQSGDVIIVPQNRFSSVERVMKVMNLGVYYPLP